VPGLKGVFVPRFKPGDSVANRLCPAWGTGVVLSVAEIVSEVQFSEAGRRRVRTEVLERIARPLRRSTPTAEADPEYETKLKNLVAAFRDTSNDEDTEGIESSIYEVFLGGGAGKPALKRQLAHRFALDKFGRPSRGHVDARSLYEFLFPEPAKKVK